jgi:hypothetical protein
MKIPQNNLLPVTFNEVVSEQDYTAVKDMKAMFLLKILLIYTGPLEFTYYSAVTYAIDINNTSANYPVGGKAYNYEKTTKGRVTGTGPEIRIVP